MKELQEKNKEKIESVLERVSATFRPREATLILFLSGVLLMKLVGLFSFFENINLVILALVFYLFSALIFRILVKKQTSAEKVINLYFGYDILIEVTVITLIVYLAGGVEWMGAIFLLFPVVYASIVLSREKALVVCYLVSLSYTLLVVLSYLGIIPFHPYFGLEANIYQQPKYVINNILLATVIFFSIGVAANLFTGILRSKTMELEETKRKLEEEGKGLEKKVNERTKELEDLAKGLEKKVKERTQKLEKKVEEANKFNKLAIGREMRMIELKKRVQELETKLKKEQ
ncbi:MAG: hypothetical protein GF370_02015 [Candidatus Nealsonbacteria bacterium]|nr:hypothetical protein [Candidatus Nealsonbacteria bacterium]